MFLVKMRLTHLRSQFSPILHFKEKSQKKTTKKGKTSWKTINKKNEMSWHFHVILPLNVVVKNNGCLFACNGIKNEFLKRFWPKQTFYFPKQTCLQTAEIDKIFIEKQNNTQKQLQMKKRKKKSKIVRNRKKKVKKKIYST